MAFFPNLFSWFRAAGALAERKGEQHPLPASPLVEETRLIGSDGALQLSAVWSCIERRANVVASLPFFAYKRASDGQKTLARDSRLYSLLHDSPNARMTPFDFWRAMMMQHDLRGNAYARIDRDATTGEAVALWPMPSDQVQPHVMQDGQMVYVYRIDDDVAVLAAENVLHLKGLGNGTVGLSKLEFMRTTLDEAAKAQNTASKLFGAQGKPTGVLMVDSVLTPAQREAIRKNFGDIAAGNTGRLFVLEAKMEYKQLALSPEDQQLLESRQFGVEEVCRWFDVPPVLAHHSNVTTWGSGIESILDGWYKLTVRPLLVSIEQAVTKRVMTPNQRARYSVEMQFDALLRGNAKDRADLYAKHVQNGIMTRNEARQLENLPPDDSANELTAQTNLVPLAMLGKQEPAPAPMPAADPILQSAIVSLRDRIEAKSADDTDRRYSELMMLLRSAGNKPQPINITNNMPEVQPVVNIKQDAPAGPVVHVHNEVSPTPVSVNVTNDVQPTPVEVNAAFEAVVQPAEVTLNMPPRKTDTVFERNRDGDITRATQVEKNI